jgi:hypothetical protein
MLFVNTGLTKDKIIFDIDISNSKSYDLNTGYTLTSLTFWENYKISDITIPYGKTMFQYGMATNESFEKNINISDRLLIFERPGEVTISGSLIYNNNITINTGITEGNSLFLSGTNLTTNFKFYEYNYQLSKYRFENAFSISTWIYIDLDTFSNIRSYTDGIFLYFGTRGENIYNIFYSSYTTSYTQYYTALTVYDENNYIEDIEYNAFCLKFNSDNTLSLRYLGESANTVEYKTDKTIQTTGWTNIVLTYLNCEKLVNDYTTKNKENELLDCKALRNGNYKLYVNGLLFDKKEDIEEFFWLHPLNTTKENQIGLPYTINWGGGSKGLQFVPSALTQTSALTSYTFYDFTTAGTEQLIDGGFETGIFGFSTNISGASLSTTTISAYSGSSSMLFSGVSFTASTGYDIDFPIITLSSDTKYEIKVKLFDISYSASPNVNLTFNGGIDSSIQILTSYTYNDISSNTQWNNIEVNFIVPSGYSGSTLLIPSLAFNNSNNINNNFQFYLDEASVKTYSKIPYTALTATTIDVPYYSAITVPSIIKDNFDGYFIGRIQKLTLYEKELSFVEVKNNYNYFATKYNFTKIP